MSSLYASQPSQKPLQKLQEELRAAVPFGAALLRKLAQEDARNTFIRRPPDPAAPWLLRVKLPDELQARYALAPEVLLMAFADTEIEARDIERARMEILGAGLRLDSEVIIVVDLKQKLHSRLQRLDRRRPWVPWQPGRQGDDFSFPSLSDQIANAIREKDIFEERDPVRGHQVIGRRDYVRKLSTDFLDAKSTGVFGLRKVGKTTLVRAVTDRLDPVGSALSVRRSKGQSADVETEDAPQVAAVWLDCQVLHPRSMDRMSSELRDRLDVRRTVESQGSAHASSDSLARLLDAFRAWVAQESLPLLLVVDEYELLFEGYDGSGPIPGIEAFFAGMRGIAQQSARLSLAVIGRDPTNFARPTWGSLPNPMLGWFSTSWVGPLDRSGADELLTTLGRRVGLVAGKRTKDLAYRLTAGHPLLHRQFGSALRQVVRERKGPLGHIETDPFCEEAVDLFYEREAVVEACREIFALQKQKDDGSGALLESLALAPESSAAQILEKHGGFRGAAARPLRNLGILQGTPSALRLPDVLRWYAQNIHPSALHSAAQ